MKIILSFVLVVLALFLANSQVLAHPGNTAADGCHYCRTNCAKWGEIEGERHCHGGTAPAPVAKPIVPVATALPRVIQATPNATQQPRATVRPAANICSAQSDGRCTASCTAGNDYDCCVVKAGYAWYDNWGCYPEEVGRCSGTADNKCSSSCTAGNDADCCSARMIGYKWYDNWGCYPVE